MVSNTGLPIARNILWAFTNYKRQTLKIYKTLKSLQITSFSSSFPTRNSQSQYRLVSNMYLALSALHFLSTCQSTLLVVVTRRLAMISLINLTRYCTKLRANKNPQFFFNSSIYNADDWKDSCTAIWGRRLLWAAVTPSVQDIYHIHLTSSGRL